MPDAEDTLDGWLHQQISSTDNARHESHRFAPNSYGSGYDQGRYDAYREALAKLCDLWEAAETTALKAGERKDG